MSKGFDLNEVCLWIDQNGVVANEFYLVYLDGTIKRVSNGLRRVPFIDAHIPVYKYH